ncbi:MAG: family 78 glycoside hydrolase catalytic domain [Clostridia bacterium]
MQLSEGSKWIWAKDCPFSENCYCEFTEIFTVEDPAIPVSVRISADSQYALWVNGQFADFGQYADYPEYKVFDTIDISHYIADGTNEMRILAYYQGTDSSTYRSGPAGIIFDITSGGKILAVSNSATRSRVASEFRNGPMEFVTWQLGYSFAYNAIDIGKNKWLASRIVNGSSQLYPRPIPKLQRGDRTPAKIVAQGYFIFHPAYLEETTAVKMQRAFLSAADISDIAGCFTRAPYTLAKNHPLRCRIDPASPAHNGENGVYVIIDIGAEESGCFELEIEAEAGTVVNIGYGEHLDDLRVRTSVGGRCFAAKYTCRAGKNKYTHYNKRFGCRYISLYIESFQFTLYYAGIRPCEYPFREKGKFSCTDMLHNKIYDICLRTLRLSAHEHYEDCPWREQALYSMDSRNQILCGYYAFGEFDLPRESIRLLSLGLREDGLLELCAPARVSAVIPSFSLIWIIELYEYILYSGDLEFAYAMWPCAEKIIRTFWRSAKGRDLLGPLCGQGYWNFYEWSQGLSDGYPEHLRDKNNKNNYDGPLTVFYLIALERMIRMAKWLYSQSAAVRPAAVPETEEIDFVEKISWCELLYSAAAASFHKTFWDSDIGAYCTYIVNGDQVHFSELMNALALYAGLVPEIHTKRVADLLSGQAVCAPGLVPITLSYAVFKYEALLCAGNSYGDFVFRDIAEKWGHMLFQNATSFWETIDGAWAFDNAGSLCHGWSATPVFLYYKYLLGVSPSGYGFSDYRFQPVKLKTPILAVGDIPRAGRAPFHVEITQSGFNLS